MVLEIINRDTTFMDGSPVVEKTYGGAWKDIRAAIVGSQGFTQSLEFRKCRIGTTIFSVWDLDVDWNSRLTKREFLQALKKERN